MSASHAHSSSIWLGASTKSHSVATPAKRVQPHVAAEHVVHQVAELVEQRHHVVVLHQPAG